MKLRIAIAAACLALAGCQTANDDVLRGVEYTCAASTALLNTATVLNTRLSNNARASISHAVSVINPVCAMESVPTLDSTAQAALTAALTELTVAVQGAQQP